MSNLLYEYQNGNCFVQLFDDGTKIREYDGEAAPLFPESIDLKITNWCDGACSFCHEKSTKHGHAAKTRTIMNFIYGLPEGIELAIGGGDPLSHPNIRAIIDFATARNIVCNLTVNSMHIERHAALIKELRKIGLKGLGVSYTPQFAHSIKNIQDENTVIHFIAGLHNVFSLCNVEHSKVLVLGFKSYGFGEWFYGNKKNKVEESLNKWRFWLSSVIKMGSNHYSFDNLALEQLKVQDFLEPQYWQQHYMGDDGQFTMYVDLVKEEFAKSSTSARSKISGTIYQMFENVNGGTTK